MFKNSLILSCLAVVIGVSGCVSAEKPSQSPEPPTSVVVPNDTGLPYELGELPAQTLQTGDCGLFLFASRPEPRFVFFGEAGSGTAKVRLNNADTLLVRTEVAGDVLDLHYTEQVYKEPIEGMELKITINEAEPVEGGSQITRASIRMSSPEGWKMVIPVGGATSCRTS